MRRWKVKHLSPFTGMTNEEFCDNILQYRPMEKLITPFGEIKILDEHDYDAVYLDNGMAYLINPHTKTKRYVFGIAWIDNVRRDDSSNIENQRDAQTWYGADPTLPLEI